MDVSTFSFGSRSFVFVQVQRTHGVQLLPHSIAHSRAVFPQPVECPIRGRRASRAHSSCRRKGNCGEPVLPILGSWYSTRALAFPPSSLARRTYVRLTPGSSANRRDVLQRRDGLDRRCQKGGRPNPSSSCARFVGTCGIRFPCAMSRNCLVERGLEAGHTTIWRRVQRYGPEPDERLRRHLKPANKSWGAMYRAIDSSGATIDFLLSALRDAAAARRLFRKALSDLSHR